METKSLKEELSMIRARLSRLRAMDPDGDDSDLLGNENDDGLGDDLLFGALPDSKPSKLSRHNARKCLILTRCPSILCCHIQRRYYDPFFNRMEKCHQHVHFEEILNMAPYSAYSPFASAPWVAGSSRQPNQDTTTPRKHKPMLYRLMSIIEHRGNASGGHYICYRRFRNSWYRVNDNTVTEIAWKHVRLCEAYMLFYEAM